MEPRKFDQNKKLYVAYRYLFHCYIFTVRFNYYEIAMIPAGATQIKVEEKSENILGTLKRRFSYQLKSISLSKNPIFTTIYFEKTTIAVELCKDLPYFLKMKNISATESAKPSLDTET